MTRYEINPMDFTDGDWVELFNACQIMPRTYETRDKAKPFKRPKGQIELAILCLENKADRITRGELGDEGGEEAWAAELNGIAETLRRLIGATRVTRKEARNRLLELLRSDIYTDAPEYADRVSEIGDLLPLVFGEAK